MATPQQSRTGGRVRWSYSRARLRWWTAAVVTVPVVIAVLVGVGSSDVVEAQLRARTTAALAGIGVHGAAVRFDGVQGEVSVPATALPEDLSLRQVEQALADVEGAHRLSVDVLGAVAEPVEPADPAESAASPSATPTATPTAAPTAVPVEPVAPDPCLDPQAQVDALVGPDRVAFGDSGAVLAGPELIQVQQVAALLAGCALPAQVVGYTADRAPGPSTVAQDRATAVASVLTAAGVAVVIVGGGRSGALGDNATAAGRRLNRYADIRVG